MTDHAKQKLVVIAGPTASGKSALAVELAMACQGEIISADSMQVYRNMDIGTAKVTKEEMQGIPHHLIDILEPEEPWNVMMFKERALPIIHEISERGHLPVVCGGTGFYLHALLYDADFQEEEGHEAIRSELEARCKASGSETLHAELMQVDPVSAERIHPNNAKRLIRALEFYQIHGTPISAHNEQMQEKQSPYDLTYIGLQMDRALLYDRIDTRVDRMIAQGLEDEVQSLLKRGVMPGMTSMQGIGYKEMIPYLQGQTDLEEAVRILKRDTRHFAKRQLTWFRAEKDLIWLDALESRKILIEKIMKAANLS